jgi:hypothetical protein
MVEAEEYAVHSRATRTSSIISSTSQRRTIYAGPHEVWHIDGRLKSQGKLCSQYSGNKKRTCFSEKREDEGRMHENVISNKQLAQSILIRDFIALL